MSPTQLISRTPEENSDLRRVVEEFVEDRIRPVAADLDREMSFPREIYRQLAAIGLFGIMVPESHGGPGGRALDYLHVMEGLSYGYSSVADQCGLVEILSGLLVQHGSAEQQERYLGPLLAAERFGAYALTESQAGSDLAAIGTTAVEQPDGSWRLTGEKVLIHNAPVADFAVVLAGTGQDERGRGVKSVFLVDLDVAGVSRSPKEVKMGQRASQVGSLRFDDVRLPSTALLGSRGEGFGYMKTILARGRLGIAGLSLGISRAAISVATEQARLRTSFGQPLWANQAVSFGIVDAATEYRAGMALAESAARMIDAGEPAATECSMAKLFASEACVRHADRAVQVFGGLGYIQGSEAERLYRDARITPIYEGTSEMQRIIIGRSMVDLRAGR